MPQSLNPEPRTSNPIPQTLKIDPKLNSLRLTPSTYDVFGSTDDSPRPRGVNCFFWEAPCRGILDPTKAGSGSRLKQTKKKGLPHPEQGLPGLRRAGPPRIFRACQDPSPQPFHASKILASPTKRRPCTASQNIDGTYHMTYYRDLFCHAKLSMGKSC